MIALRTDREVALLRDANQIVAEVLCALADMVAPGVSTGALDALAEETIRARGAEPSFLGYRGYPRATCISVDDVIVHGIPGSQVLQEGQIVSIDVGAFWRGYHGDAAVSVACGKLDKDRQRLMTATDRALARAIKAAKAGNYVGDISEAIETTCKAEGFKVVRAFVGHGIGTAMHEEPQIPNFVSDERGALLRPGMVLAIEPMVNMGTHEARVLDDGWTAVTADGKPSAHFEHSIVVRDGAADVLSASARRSWGMGG